MASGGRPPDLPPFLAKLMNRAAHRPLLPWSGDPWPALAGDPPWWQELSQAGFSLGLVNLPAGPLPGPGFWLPPQGEAGGHPAELANDLADYRHPPGPAPVDSSLPRLQEFHSRTLAASRIIFEHACRLAARQRPALLAVHLGRVPSPLAWTQFDRLAQSLAQLQAAEALLLLTLGEPAALLAWAPGRLRPGALPPAPLAGLGGALARLLGLPLKGGQTDLLAGAWPGPELEAGLAR